MKRRSSDAGKGRRSHQCRGTASPPAVTSRHLSARARPPAAPRRRASWLPARRTGHPFSSAAGVLTRGDLLLACSGRRGRTQAFPCRDDVFRQGSPARLGIRSRARRRSPDWNGTRHRQGASYQHGHQPARVHPLPSVAARGRRRDGRRRGSSRGSRRVRRSWRERPHSPAGASSSGRRCRSLE